jgi:competence transcription factor ComK
MTDNSSLEKSSNKSFITNNHALLKDYAQKKRQSFGLGIIVINLLLLKTEKIDGLNLLDTDLAELNEATIHQPISYIPCDNFWFKTINLKIKQRHKIDLQAENNADQISIVFIKDVAIEHFSIYTLKLRNSQS